MTQNILKLIPKQPLDMSEIKPVPAVVEMCEDLLKRAQSGQLQALAISGCDADGRVIEGASDPGDFLYVIMGGLYALQTKICNQFVGD